MSSVVRRSATGILGLAAAGAACVAYGALYEVNAFMIRRVAVPILPPGSPTIRILHLSDIHLTPRNHARRAFVASLAAEEPDLVIDTGDNISHPDSGSLLIKSLGRLLDVPGVFVWGSNDYYAPTFKNPVTYLLRPSRVGSPTLTELPWRELGADFERAGWIDLTERRATLEINGVRIGFRGTDDAHLGKDRYDEVAGPVDRGAEGDIVLGVTHAPYRRVIDGMAADGLDLIIAGHTHGGQVCVPFYGALITNCDLDTARVKGLSQHSAGGHTAYLEVSAGLGTSPYAPFRFACRPEATVLTLVPQLR